MASATIAEPSATHWIASLLEGFRYHFSEERDLHSLLRVVLAQNRIRFRQECRLSPRDRVDFFLFDFGIAIEVKVKGGTSEIVRQLKRYAERKEVQGLILVTTRRLHACQMPDSINGKPLGVSRISLAAL